MTQYFRSTPWRTTLMLLLCTVAGLAGSGLAAAQTKEDARLIMATSVLEEFEGSPDQRVPDWLIERAYGIAVIPDVIKGAIGIGARVVMDGRDLVARGGEPLLDRRQER